MSEADDFLSRWSRRKRAVAAEHAEASNPVAPEALPAEALPAETSDDASVARAPDVPAPAAPKFDVDSLPPIDSIGANTDISLFLKPGVPSALRHAALRRAWTSDPVIRTFKGLAENDWDFNSPDTPGFGPLDPGFDVEKMVAQLFGDAQPSEEIVPEPQAAASETQAAASEQKSCSSRELPAVDTPAAVDVSTIVESQSPPEACMEQKIVQCDEHIASQQDEMNYKSAQANIRRHGTALPRMLPEY
jgi:Protein of unknown function (DUF3306)